MILLNLFSYLGTKWMFKAFLNFHGPFEVSKRKKLFFELRFSLFQRKLKRWGANQRHLNSEREMAFAGPHFYLMYLFSHWSALLLWIAEFLKWLAKKPNGTILKKSHRHPGKISKFNIPIKSNAIGCSCLKCSPYELYVLYVTQIKYTGMKVPEE